MDNEDEGAHNIIDDILSSFEEDKEVVTGGIPVLMLMPTNNRTV